MKLTHRTGNLFHQRDLPAWAHGVNCAGAMGRGIAVPFKAFFPEMFDEYQERCRLKVLNPGDVFAWQPTASELDHAGHQLVRVVYNLATQASWRAPATHPAIAKSVEAMIIMAAHEKVRQIGMPRVGSGLGGLHWPDVHATIARVCGAHMDLDVEIVVVTP